MGLFRPSRVVHAHCDLPCGVYDPAQARIEAESVKAIQDQIKDPSKRKGMGDDETVWLARAAKIKEERAELTKHHLWVLWTDYFKPEHKEKFPELHETFWKATKAAGEAKHSEDPTSGQALLDQIAEIDKVFWETKK
jgi:nickel superoxide dismutase